MGRPRGGSKALVGGREEREKKRKREALGRQRNLGVKTGFAGQSLAPPLPVPNVMCSNYNITPSPAVTSSVPNNNQREIPWEGHGEVISWHTNLNGAYLVPTPTTPTNLSQNFRNRFVAPRVDIMDLGVESWPFPLESGFGVDSFTPLELQLSQGDVTSLDMEGVPPVDANDPRDFGNMMAFTAISGGSSPGFSSESTAIPAFGLPEFTLPANNLPGQQRPNTSSNPDQPCPLSTLPTCLCPSTFHECHKALQSAVLILQAITGPNTPTPNAIALQTTYLTALTLGKVTLNACRNLILCSICQVASMPNMLLVGAMLPVMVGVYENAIEVLLDRRLYGDLPEIGGLATATWRRVAIEALRRDMKEVERIAVDMVQGAINGAKVRPKHAGESDQRELRWKAKGEAMEVRRNLRKQERERGKQRDALESEGRRSVQPPSHSASSAGVRGMTPGANRIPLQTPHQHPIPNTTALRAPRTTISAGATDSDSDDVVPPCLKHFPREQLQAIVERTADDPDKALPPCVRTVLEMQDHVRLWTEGIELAFERGMRIEDWDEGFGEGIKKVPVGEKVGREAWKAGSGGEPWNKDEWTGERGEVVGGGVTLF